MTREQLTHGRNVAPRSTQATNEEVLVSDSRAGLTPAQQVERKVASLLKDGYLPVSRTALSTTLARRGT